MATLSTPSNPSAHLVVRNGNYAINTKQSISSPGSPQRQHYQHQAISQLTWCSVTLTPIKRHVSSPGSPWGTAWTPGVPDNGRWHSPRPRSWRWCWTRQWRRWSCAGACCPGSGRRRCSVWPDLWDQSARLASGVWLPLCLLGTEVW